MSHLNLFNKRLKNSYGMNKEDLNHIPLSHIIRQLYIYFTNYKI